MEREAVVEGLTGDALAEALLQAPDLPSLPHVLLEIYQLLFSDVAGVDRIAVLLETDAALTARTLRLANSAYYRMPREVVRVDEAVSRIGPFDVWWLLFTTEVKGLFFGIDRQLMDMEGFWRHSLFTACASRSLAEYHGIGVPGDFFVAGLLHDIGKLLLLQQLPVEYGPLLAEAAETGQTLSLLEQERLGLGHALIGGRLLEAWGLPELVVSQALQHHRAIEEISASSLVAVANQAAHMLLDEISSPTVEAFLEDGLISSIEADYRQRVEMIL